MIEIKNKWNGSIIYSGDHETLKDAVASAIVNRAVLRGAYLRNAYLSGADLSNADLSGADLSGADLSNADLSNADLSGVYLSNADLSGVYLSGADLSGADLSNADLSNAYLRNADLSGVYLSGADLSGADLSNAYLRNAYLTPIRDDLWAVISASPAEVSGLRDALLAGKINGSAYEGDCACLVGTLAKVAHCKYTELPILIPNQSRPSERWFLQIKPGDTPENSQAVKLTLGWVDEWIANMRAAFGRMEN